MSGACNPDVIRKLMNLGAEIKMVDGMHARIYWTRAGAIIGSANASANGLIVSSLLSMEYLNTRWAR
jgi:hypothetical protein